MPYKNPEDKKAYGRSYYQKNKEKVLEWSRKYYDNHRGKEVKRSRKERSKALAAGLCGRCKHRPVAKNQMCEWCIARSQELERKYARQVKAAVISAYGGKCACCGESTPEFLSIDHVDGDGANHRRAVSNGRKRQGGGRAIYRWLRARNFPDGFRLLCYNCNCSLGFLGYCPHHPNEKATSPPIT